MRHHLEVLFRLRYRLRARYHCCNGGMTKNELKSSGLERYAVPVADRFTTPCLLQDLGRGRQVIEGRILCQVGG